MSENTEFGPHRTAPSEAETAKMGGCLTRVVWLVAAPLALLMLGAVVARNGGGALSKESIAYWAVVLVALVVRYVDIFRYRGETMEGAPASREDWRRYSLRFPYWPWWAGLRRSSWGKYETHQFRFAPCEPPGRATFGIEQRSQ